MRNPSNIDAFEPIARGVAQAGVRIANERAVLTLIAGLPGSSNADIARRSGLGPQTTARILADFEARGLVERGQVLRGRRGQPATPYRLNPDGAFSIGVEIGWSHLEILLFSMGGRPVAAIRRSHDFPAVERVFPQIAAEVGTLLAGLRPDQRARVVGIGLATPGTLGRTLDRLGAPPAQMRAWTETDMVARVAADTGLETTWINDGNAACWSQIVAQPAPRPGAFACFQIGTFVGGGVVSGGALWEGPTGNAADLGSIMVADRAGRPSYAHLVASLYALRRRLAEAGFDPPPNPRHWPWPDWEPVVAGWIEEAGHALAQAVMSVRAIMEIDLALVDGELPRDVLERLLQAVRRHLAALPPLGHGLPRIGLGRVGSSAAALGAAQLVLFRRYFSRPWDLFAS